MYEYKATVVKVIDGDTVKLNIDLGFHLTRNEQNFRLIGIDAPEIRGDERQKGLICKEFVESLISEGEEVYIRTYKPDKYGRWLVDIQVNVPVEDNDEMLKEESLSHYLVEKGYAKVYDGTGSVAFPLDEQYPLPKE
jgi:micrococcal nuclease